MDAVRRRVFGKSRRWTWLLLAGLGGAACSGSEFGASGASEGGSGGDDATAGGGAGDPDLGGDTTGASNGGQSGETGADATGGEPVGTSSGGTGSGHGGAATAGGTAGTTASGGAGGNASGGSGGSGGVTCPQYSGSLGKDSVIFNEGYGQSTKGSWRGDAFTYKYGTATIAPGMGNRCFAGAQMCVNGSVPADDASGAGLGWYLSQTQGTSAGTKVAITKPVVIKFAGVTAGMRLELSASSTADLFCYTFTPVDVAAGTATVPLASFKTNCWDLGGTAYAGTPIESIQVVVPGSAAVAKPFDFCLLDVEPG